MNTFNLFPIIQFKTLLAPDPNNKLVFTLNTKRINTKDIQKNIFKLDPLYNDYINSLPKTMNNHDKVIKSLSSNIKLIFSLIANLIIVIKQNSYTAVNFNMSVILRDEKISVLLCQKLQLLRLFGESFYNKFFNTFEKIYETSFSWGRIRMWNATTKYYNVIHAMTFNDEDKKIMKQFISIINNKLAKNIQNIIKTDATKINDYVDIKFKGGSINNEFILYIDDNYNIYYPDKNQYSSQSMEEKNEKKKIILFLIIMLIETENIKKKQQILCEILKYYDAFMLSDEYYEFFYSNFEKYKKYKLLKNNM